jgi:putative endonuclease
MPDDEPVQPNPSASTGRRGEDIAARYLVRHDCTILARNWRSNPGEIDIIAECPASTSANSRERELAFIEVRTRHGRPGLGEESISRRKATNMLTAAYAYMAAHNIDPEAIHWRIDLIAIAMSGATITGINWVRDAIEEDMLE